MKTLSKVTRRRSKSLTNLSSRPGAGVDSSKSRIGKKFSHGGRKRCNTVKGLSMLSVMSADQVHDISKDFLTTGRTGRRNALPDILGENARTSVADLPDQLGALSTSDDGASTSKDSSVPSTSTSTSTATPSTNPPSGTAGQTEPSAPS
uniref:Uncharacterized protein n=1 Tax=Cacopsylla melanoneura TaxID=428564 RepID=A0A8D8S5E3_9HEMI